MSEAVVEAAAQEVKKARISCKKLIALCTPTLGTVSMWWHNATMNLMWPMNIGKGIVPVVDQVGGEIAECRNRCVQIALAHEKAGVELEAIFWLDDDVLVMPVCLLALAQHFPKPGEGGHLIVSGCYFCKGEYPEPLIFPGACQGTGRFVPDSVKEVWGWAQGLSLVHPSVYKRMEAELPLGKDKYGNPAWYALPEFEVGPEGGVTTGGTEDFRFFKNADLLGIKCLQDCTKHAFGFHWDEANKTAYPKEQWQQWLNRQPITWTKPDGTVVTWS